MKMPRATASCKLRTGLAVTLTSAALTPSAVQALGIRVPDQDPFAIARGNAFVATADNPSAIYYNPAGITQLSGHNFSFGANILSVSDRYTSPTGAEFDTESKVHVLPQFYYAFSPESMPLSFGLGFYSPFGLGVEWPDQTPFRQLALKGEMAYATINPVVAWKINENVSIGAGAMINYADTTLSRGLAPAGAPVPSGNRLEFNGDGWSAGFNFGVRWEITERHSVGATYRSATEMSFSGDTFISFPTPVTLPSSADFQLPQNVTVGYSFRPNEKWNIEINADWTDWESLDTVVLEQPSPPNVDLPFNWRSSWMIMLGGTRYLNNGWNVSAGYIFSENSVPDESFNPSVPDSDRHVFSAGFGKQVNQVSVDFALQYGYGPTRTISNPVIPLEPTPNGDYVFHSISAVIGVGYSF